jgi:hypothetical protein
MEQIWLGNAWSSILSWVTAILSDAGLWSGFWPAIFGAAAGALFAFYLERAYRRRDQVASECAKANRLISALGRMLAAFENMHATIFRDAPEGQQAEPLGYGPVFGVPVQILTIDFGEFDFLLETNDPHDRCATALGRAHFAHAKFDEAIALFNARNDTARQYKLSRAASMFGRGPEGAGRLNETDTLRDELTFLTEQLRQALPAGISLLKEVVPELRTALAARYPGRQFLRLFPQDKALPPL